MLCIQFASDIEGESDEQAGGHLLLRDYKNPLDEATLNALDHLARRVITVADRLN
jgi:hypothetical protein